MRTKRNRICLTYSLMRLHSLIVAALLTCSCAAQERSKADLDHPDALVRQHRSASKSDKDQAAKRLRDAEQAFQSARFDLAAKLYGESALHHPTFKALSGYGEATARSDRKRPTQGETLAAQKSAFDAAARRIKVALEFASKVPGQAKPADVERAQQTLACLESYSGGATHGCEPVRSVLGRYAARSK